MTLQEELRKRIPILSRADAAEIERWMEWARRSHALPDYIAAGPGKWPPLTLPPDGWKP